MYKTVQITTSFFKNLISVIKLFYFYLVLFQFICWPIKAIFNSFRVIHESWLPWVMTAIGPAAHWLITGTRQAYNYKFKL